MSFEYELLVIGSGPAGQRAAIQAAKLRRRVALVERSREVGGSCVNLGTIPSKTIREAILYLTARTRYVVERERNVIRDQLRRNHVTLIEGQARFVDPHTVNVTDSTGGERHASAERIVIATGSRPSHESGIAFNGETIVDSDDIVLRLSRIPGTLVVVGVGVIGIEFASMFAAALGTKVTVVDARSVLLEFCDEEITEALRYHLRDLGVTFRFGEVVTEVVEGEGGTLTTLSSGKQIAAEAVFYSAGRVGATDDLQLENADLEADERGRIAVGERYRTTVEHIWAAGDVIGFPSLAATSAEQGRIASADAFGHDVHSMPHQLPFGIYSIPEISYVGKTESDLTEDSIPYEVGRAHYRELARGQIVGDSHGMVKLLVSPSDRTLLGVHAFGAGATEVVHIGQAVIGLGGTMDYLVDSVFNYPTLAEAYKVAALDAVNKLHAVRVASGEVPVRG